MMFCSYVITRNTYNAFFIECKRLLNFALQTHEEKEQNGWSSANYTNLHIDTCEKCSNNGIGVTSQRSPMQDI